MVFSTLPTLVALFAAFSTVNAQASTGNNTQLQLQAIRAHFSQAGLVPVLLSTFNPVATLDVDFDGADTNPADDLKPGQKLTRPQVQNRPTLKLTPANSTVQLPQNYTVAMVDAGPVGSDQNNGQTRHWLVNGVSLDSGDDLQTQSGSTITNYAGPAPPAGSGPHRYVFLVFEQPADFAPPADLSSPQPVAVFNINNYVTSSSLGNLVAANYFTVEEGTATASLSSTSAVVTSTLPAAASSTAGTATTAGAPPPSQSTGSAFKSQVSQYALIMSAAAAFFLI